MVICVAGNIASGKTTLCKNLSTSLCLKLFEEDVEDNPFLELFYKNMAKWSYPLEAYFLARRFAKHKIAEKEGGIIDRSIWEDRIFASNLYEKGLFDEKEYIKYSNDFIELESVVEEPDFIFYLKTSVNVLWDRLRERNRKIEKDIKIEYLEELNEKYEFMFGSTGVVPKVIVIDTSALNKSAVFKIAFDKVLAVKLEKLKQKNNPVLTLVK